MSLAQLHAWVFTVFSHFRTHWLYTDVVHHRKAITPHFPLIMIYFEAFHRLRSPDFVLQHFTMHISPTCPFYSFLPYTRSHAIALLLAHILYSFRLISPRFATSVRPSIACHHIRWYSATFSVFVLYSPAELRIRCVPVLGMFYYYSDHFRITSDCFADCVMYMTTRPPFIILLLPYPIWSFSEHTRQL